MRFVLLGKAGDIWKELAFMTQLEQKTGQVLTKYIPVMPPESRN